MPTGMRPAQVNKSRASIAVLLQDLGDIFGEMGNPLTPTTISNVRCQVERYKPTMPPPPSVINDVANLYMLTVPWNQALEVQWQFIHGGHTYVIKSIFDDDTPLLSKMAYMERITK